MNEKNETGIAGILKGIGALPLFQEGH